LCHPGEHKAAAITYFHNMLKTYNLTPESRQKEKNTMQQILNNNKHDTSVWDKVIKEKAGNRMTKKRKRCGQNSCTLAKKRDSI
jgi:hypothetical protein